jgi:hypothetical protein
MAKKRKHAPVPRFCPHSTESTVSVEAFLVMEITTKRDPMAAFLMRALAGGNCGGVTHVAERVDGRLSSCRETVKLIRAVARNDGVDLRFARIMRPGDLIDWALSNPVRVQVSV